MICKIFYYHNDIQQCCLPCDIQEYNLLWNSQQWYFQWDIQQGYLFFGIQVCSLLYYMQQDCYICDNQQNCLFVISYNDVFYMILYSLWDWTYWAGGFSKCEIWWKAAGKDWEPQCKLLMLINTKPYIVYLNHVRKDQRPFPVEML